MANIPWYRKYNELHEEVLGLKEDFTERCLGLGVDPNKVFEETRREIISRIVHESNWQEGLYLDQGRTQELTDVVFEKLSGIEGPHIDINPIVEAHRDRVLEFKRKGLSVEELAGYNLSFAHVTLSWIAIELSERQAATFIQALNGIKDFYSQHKRQFPAESRRAIDRGFEVIEQLKTDSGAVYSPLTENIGTHGELVKELEKVNFDSLLSPMRLDYIHFLHRITMMGILPSKKIGVFRKTSVHVGDPDVFFPSVSTVPKLMDEFCDSFPTILPTTVKYDPIKKAADTSYRLARIHPYADGNGRISRLVMNLVLWGHFPPVYLKADKKGRHRYSQALKRANRGNIEPLACLIAMSLKEIYRKLLDAVNVV